MSRNYQRHLKASEFDNLGQFAYAVTQKGMLPKIQRHSNNFHHSEFIADRRQNETPFLEVQLESIVKSLMSYLINSF